jgi:hypothetical protein
MIVHSLSGASPDALVDAVCAALAGGDLSDVAGAFGLPVEQLSAALATYHAAGAAAVTRASYRWYTTTWTSIFDP